MMSIRRHQSKNTKPLALLVMCLLVFMLLLSQTMGLLHAVVHSPGASVSSGQVYGQSYGPSGLALDGLAVKRQAKANAPRAVVSQNWLAALFASHTGHADCRLYDQASHGGALVLVAAVILPVVLESVATLVFHAKTPLRNDVALFDARGPPLMR